MGRQIYDNFFAATNLSPLFSRKNSRPQQQATHGRCHIINANAGQTGVKVAIWHKNCYFCTQIITISNPLNINNRMNILEISQVVKQYDGHLALDHVDLTVPEGCTYGLLGPNGAGKTSLIRIINCITRPDSGTVLLNGQPIQPTDVAHIGYLPEERGLYKKMKVQDHIVYLARLKGVDKATATQRAKQWLERFELTEWAGKKVEALSKGMQQKVQFIATVVHEPKLLIFDEPFSGFDPVNADLLKHEILRLRDLGATILFSTHNMESVEEVCEHITLINHAKVVLEGRVSDIKQRHKQGVYRIALEPGAVLDERPALFRTLAAPTQPGGDYTIALAQGVTAREAIAQLNSELPLAGFHEVLPSMHEIFVETVTQTQAPQS